MLDDDMDSGDITMAEQTLQIGGVQRHYLTVRPRTVTGAGPLIVTLHGSGLDPIDQLRVSRIDRLARSGAVVVAPRGQISYALMEGWPLGWAWNVPGSPLPGEDEPRREPDDIRFLTELLAVLLSDLPVDPTRVHVVGYSGGARLASHLPAVSPWLASVTGVAGLRYPTDVTGNAVSIIAVHGQEDPINPYLGGAGPRWSESAEQCVERWAGASGSDMPPRVVDLGDGVVELNYDPGPAGAEVRLVTIPRIGHAWPGTVDVQHQARFGCAGPFDVTDYLARNLSRIQTQDVDGFWVSVPATRPPRAFGVDNADPS